MKEVVVLLNETLYDCIIIGGGPAGLSAAITLGRACRNILLLDEGNPRSRVTQSSHGYLTQDGIKPASLRQMGYKELAHYPNVRVMRDTATDVHKSHENFFEVSTKSGNLFSSKKILFATGLIDVLPDIDGISDVYGKSAFICPYCDGFEFRNEPLAIIGHQIADIHFVKALRCWSNDIAFFTNGEQALDEKQIEEFHERRIPIYESRIQSIEHEDGYLTAILLSEGQRISRKAIFFNPLSKQASQLPKKLGVAINDLGYYEANEDGKTAIEGVYIAGDNRNHLHQIIHAASDGGKAAVGINMELIKEDWHAKK